MNRPEAEPPDPEASRARAFLAAGRPGAARRLLEGALRSRPGESELVELLAECHRRAGRPLEALRELDGLTRLGTAVASTWRLAGETLLELGEFAQAAGQLERARREERRDPRTLAGLGQAAFALGDLDRAVRLYSEAWKLSGRTDFLLNLATIAPGAPSLRPAEVLRLRRELAARLQEAEPEASATPPPRRSGAGPLRVGYLSGHFLQANYMKPVWALLDAHDREAFEIHLFHDSPARADPRRDRSDRLHRVGGTANAELCERIRREELDVLVDLSSYSRTDRLGLFLRSPAPVVVAWFNSFATSGLPGVHVIVGDDEVVTRREETHHSEEVRRLPLSYLSFEVQHEAPPVANPPSLRGEGLAFGSLVALYKITPPVLDDWGRILRKAPDSRLVVGNRDLGSAENRRWFAERMRERGVAEDRLTLLGPAEHARYLGYYDRIDVALDAYPYSGGTTTMEALWQGVPVLAHEGDRWAARTSRTLLRRTHLADFVVKNRRSLVRRAIALARDPETPERLRVLRSEMRERLRASSACDGPGLARAMEELYRSLTAEAR